jgi:hypothetical protein
MTTKRNCPSLCLSNNESWFYKKRPSWPSSHSLGIRRASYVELHDVAALGRLLGRRQEEDVRERREAEAEQQRRSREFRP